jgi:hypothetical protein
MSIKHATRLIEWSKPMTNGKASATLVEFVEHVLRNSGDQGRPPKIADLPIAIRAERLTEYSSWTYRDLDLIEQEGALHSKDTPLAALVS